MMLDSSWKLFILQNEWIIFFTYTRIFKCHVDFTNSVRCRHLVIVENCSQSTGIWFMPHRANKNRLFSLFPFLKSRCSLYKPTPWFQGPKLRLNSRLIHRYIRYFSCGQTPTANLTKKLSYVTLHPVRLSIGTLQNLPSCFHTSRFKKIRSIHCQRHYKNMSTVTMTLPP